MQAFLIALVAMGIYVGGTIPIAFSLAKKGQNYKIPLLIGIGISGTCALGGIVGGLYVIAIASVIWVGILVGMIFLCKKKENANPSQQSTACENPRQPSPAANANTPVSKPVSSTPTAAANVNAPAATAASTASRNVATEEEKFAAFNRIQESYGQGNAARQKTAPIDTNDTEALLKAMADNAIDETSFFKALANKPVWYSTPVGDTADGRAVLFLRNAPDGTKYLPVFTSVERANKHFKDAGRTSFMLFNVTFAQFIISTIQTNAEGKVPVKLGGILDPDQYGFTFDAKNLETIRKMMQ